MTLKIDRERIKKRIKEIHHRLQSLKHLEKENEEIKFLVDETISAASERHLQIAIQACLDIADHLIAKLSLETPKEDKKEVFPILAQNKIISPDLAAKMKRMAGMRNVLVHNYTEVQRQKVYNAIKKDLTDIIDFVTQIQKFLDKLETSR